MAPDYQFTNQNWGTWINIFFLLATNQEYFFTFPSSRWPFWTWFILKAVHEVRDNDRWPTRSGFLWGGIGSALGVSMRSVEAYAASSYDVAGRDESRSRGALIKKRVASLFRWGDDDATTPPCKWNGTGNSTLTTTTATTTTKTTTREPLDGNSTKLGRIRSFSVAGASALRCLHFITLNCIRYRRFHSLFPLLRASSGIFRPNFSAVQVDLMTRTLGYRSFQ